MDSLEQPITIFEEVHTVQIEQAITEQETQQKKQWHNQSFGD